MYEQMRPNLILLIQSEKIHVFFENNWEDQTLAGQAVFVILVTDFTFAVTWKTPLWRRIQLSDSH